LNQVNGVWRSEPDGDILPFSPDLACRNLRVSADPKYSLIVVLCSSHLKSTLSVTVYGQLINNHYTYPLDEQYTSFELFRLRESDEIEDAKFAIALKKENLTGTSMLMVPFWKDRFSNYWT
jgi:hypothetical protein